MLHAPDPDIEKLDAVTPKQVMEAVRELAVQRTDSRFTAFSMVTPAAEKLGVNPYPYSHSHRGQAASSRFDGRVSRALDKLAAEGALYRVGYEKTGPGGARNERREVRYYTQEAWDKEARQVKAQLAEASAFRQQQDEIVARLAGLGINGQRGSHSGSVLISLADWQKLLDQVGS